MWDVETGTCDLCALFVVLNHVLDIQSNISIYSILSCLHLTSIFDFA